MVFEVIHNVLVYVLIVNTLEDLVYISKFYT